MSRLRVVSWLGEDFDGLGFGNRWVVGLGFGCAKGDRKEICLYDEGDGLAKSRWQSRNRPRLRYQF